MKYARIATTCALATAGLFAHATALKPFKTVEDAVAAAHKDAEKRLGDKAKGAAMELITADNVRWPNSSLGCPKPGLSYTPAVVPGYRVRLRVNGEEWDYHASERGVLVLCPQEQRKSGRPPRPRPDSKI